MAQQLQRHQAFLRLGKITKGPESALIAARHNLRELPLAPNMVEGKQSLNVVLQGPGSAAAVQASYEKVLAKNGVNKLRKDAVRLIEALVSLPVGVDDLKHQYFKAAFQWLATEFGTANILSAVIHKDEAAQHMHVLIVPLVAGRMRGSDLMGGPGIMRDRHARFVSAMQQPWTQLGVIVEQPLRVRKAAMAQEVLAYLKQADDAMWKSSVVQVIRDYIESNPESFYLTLGLSHRGTACPVQWKRRSQATKQRTMAQIFTRPIKGMCGVKAERYRQSEEYLRAHVVASPRKLPVADTHDVLAAVGNAEHEQSKGLVAAKRHVPVLLPVPSKQTRTLCSVGFDAAPIQIHSAAVASFDGAAMKRQSKPRDGQPRYFGHSVFTGERHALSCAESAHGALVLQAKLLYWWLLRARVH